jgi:hypothetical protein
LCPVDHRARQLGAELRTLPSIVDPDLDDVDAVRRLLATAARVSSSARTPYADGFSGVRGPRSRREPRLIEQCAAERRCCAARMARGNRQASEREHGRHAGEP